MLCQHDCQQDSPPQKTHREPILSFALLLARPSAFLVTATQKKSCVRSQRRHTMIFLREAGHHASPSQQYPPKKTQHAGAPRSRNSDMLAPGASKDEEGTGREKSLLVPNREEKDDTTINNSMWWFLYNKCCLLARAQSKMRMPRKDDR